MNELNTESGAILARVTRSKRSEPLRRECNIIVHLMQIAVSGARVAFSSSPRYIESAPDTGPNGAAEAQRTHILEEGTAMKNINSRTILFVTGAFVSHTGWDEWQTHFRNKGY